MSSALPYDVDRLSTRCEEILTQSLGWMCQCGLDERVRKDIFEPKIREMRYATIKQKIEKVIENIEGGVPPKINKGEIIVPNPKEMANITP